MQTLESYAKEMAGNWQRFHDFFCEMDDWERRGIDPINVATVYTSNRDSTLMAESNEYAILKEMKHFLGEDAITIRHNHWACGYVDGLEILVYNQKGEITKAWKKYCELIQSIQNYPVLDEEDYSRREFDATYGNILDALRSFQWRRDDLELPDDIASRMYSWFDEHDQSAIENKDDTGGYPSEEELTEALTALGFLKEEAET